MSTSYARRAVKVLGESGRGATRAFCSEAREDRAAEARAGTERERVESDIRVGTFGSEPAAKVHEFTR
jgi:hypothetical protein